MPRLPTLGLVVAVAAGLAPVAHAQRVTLPASVDTLPNGLVLIVHEDHSAPLVAVNVWYHVGSGDERPGRTGFAHLFEHLMFMGSQHAPYPEFDRRLEGAGADNNGSTTEDRTNYYESGPAHALPLMLWLEADRMGWMLPTMDGPKVDLQRDVVKNERRQRLENQPYGMAWDHLPGMQYPAGHPYSWPVIGSMADLSAASLEDVKDFFRRYYAPNNAALVVAGAVRAPEVRRLVTAYFGDIPRGPAIERPAPPRRLARDTAVVLEDRVQVPRLILTWPTVAAWSADDAALEVTAYLLAGAENSRLTRRLVHVERSAATVNAAHDAKRLDGDFLVIADAQPGRGLDALRRAIDAELERLASEGPAAEELEQARTALEAGLLRRLEAVGAKADQLNAYYYHTGTPDAAERELEGQRAVTAADVRRVVARYLRGPRGVLSVVPQGRPELAVGAGGSP